MKKSDLVRIIREEVRSVINEEDFLPTMPSGQKVTDPKIIQYLDKSLLKIKDTATRTRVKDLLSDPTLQKPMKWPEKTAMLAGIAAALGVTKDELSRALPVIKKVLPDDLEAGSMTTNTTDEE